MSQKQKQHWVDYHGLEFLDTLPTEAIPRRTHVWNTDLFPGEIKKNRIAEITKDVQKLSIKVEDKATRESMCDIS